MKHASKLDEFLSFKTRRKIGKRIILKNPSSSLNFFKRVLAFLIGILVIFIFTMSHMESEDFFSSIEISDIGFVAIFGFGFIYYAIRRSHIHKKCYVDFGEHSISGRIPAPLNSYPAGRDMALRMMFNPQFEEFEFKFDNISEIEIKTTSVILKSNLGISQAINLENFDYDILKTIKDKFFQLKKSLEV